MWLLDVFKSVLLIDCTCAHPVGADAEPVPELEFDQTVGW